MALDTPTFPIFAPRMEFKLLTTDPKSKARAGELLTDHGVVPTPIFMPVGTQATVKAISQEDLEEIGFRLILGNTYHLYPVSYTHLRAHQTVLDLVCRLLLEKKKTIKKSLQY